MSDGDGAGPGRAGGLLFVGVVVFLAFLAVTGKPGWWGGVLAAVLVAAALVLTIRVLRRR